MPSIAAAPRRGRSRRPLIVILALIVAVAVVYELFGDEIVSTATVIVFGEPVAPVVVRPPAGPRAKSVATPATPAPAAAAPAPVVAAAETAASAPLSAETPAATAPVATTETPAPADAAAPTAQSSPAPATAPVQPLAPAVAAPAVAAAATAPIKAIVTPPPAKTAIVAAEQDLPAVLDRIRQQRTKATLQPNAVVDRMPTNAQSKSGTSSAVDGMVSVATTSAQERDDTERAYDMLLHGQYEGALETYTDVLKMTPDSVPALLGKAIALHKLQRLTEARPVYQRVLAIDSNNREALTNLMSIIAAQAPAAALSELRDLQNTYPAFSPIAAEIAQIDAQTGNFADAIASFNKAIQLSPDNALYRLNLAIIQDRAGMQNEAAQSYEAALNRLGTGAQLPIPIETIRARLRYLRSR